ncbi:MAG TPA: GTPase Era [Candidatus Aphodoplasma excrementigallinarum]|uniref:GTPase Era n=1 Tax=Candidatus Aphodoplasma excrementigallinarum TaxID=2840673 RepID=A0A9D1NG58_9FIRM|nr:GTPase Era [Candidatus Aphodoplasma excrementigallinarum]
MKNQNFKSGFVSIIGRPNVGKSTLLNALVGEKIAIISDKPQTTRNKILAIRNTDDAQIIFTDTPGIHKPKNKLGEYMVKVANESVGEMDVVLFVVDATNKTTEPERKIAQNLRALRVPVILVINKVDLARKESLLPMIADFSSLHDFEAIVPISALKNDGVDRLLNEIMQNIPQGPAFFPDDMITDQPEKQIAAEIIREKLLWLLDKEVPHGIAIEILQMKEQDKLTSIQANIYCEKASHKGIIIGKNGAILKKVGTMARIDIQKMLGKKVYLELWVKVKSDWRNNNYLIRNFGYE